MHTLTWWSSQRNLLESLCQTSRLSPAPRGNTACHCQAVQMWSQSQTPHMHSTAANRWVTNTTSRKQREGAGRQTILHYSTMMLTVCSSDVARAWRTSGTLLFSFFIKKKKNQTSFKRNIKTDKTQFKLLTQFKIF